MKMKTAIVLFFSILVFGASFVFAKMDDARLKERLTDGALLLLLTEEHFWSGITGELGEHSHSELKEVTDEQFHRVLMEIYNEAEEKMQTLTPNTVEWGHNKDMAARVLVCLPMCGDISVKNFLLDYAASKEKDNRSRTTALSSYLRAADAEEAKDVLLRFLVGEERMDDYSRSSLYVHAKNVWALSSPDKKTSIFQALCEAASSESPPWLFEECDSRLLLMDPAWRDSPRRETMLIRQLSLPFSVHYTELKTQMKKEIERIKKVKKNSSIGTNHAALAVRDLNLPHPYVVTNGAKGDVHEGPDAEPVTADESSHGTFVFFGVAALILLGIGAWRFMRR